MGLSRKSIFLNLFWSSTGFLTGILRTIFLIPVFLSNWNERSYGFWLLIANFYAISIYVIDGFSRYMINEYSKLFYTDKLKAYKYFGGGLRLLCFVTGVALLLLFIAFQFTWPAERLFHVNDILIDKFQLGSCIITMFFLVTVHSIAKYIANGIIPHGKVYVPERFIAIYSLVEAIIWLLASFGKVPLFHLYIIYSLVLSLLSIVFALLISRNQKFYKIIYFRADLRLVLKNATGSIALIVNNFCEKFTVEGLNFLVSALFTAVMVPVYSTMRAMANFMVSGSNMVVATFTIEYQKLYVTKNGRSLLNLFNATWLLIGFLVNYGLIIFYPFLPDVFELWTKGKLQFQQQFFDYILAATVCIVFGSNIIIYLKSVNKIKKIFVVSIARVILLVGFIAILPKELVFIGMGLFIAEAIINMFLLNAMLYHELGKFQSGAVLGKLFWNALPFITTVLYVLVNRFIPVDTYLKMISALIIVTTIYAVQISRVDNEALLVRLQIIKYKLFGKITK